jgi:hypothetical protein
MWNCLFYFDFAEEYKVTIDGEIKTQVLLIILKDWRLTIY